MKRREFVARAALLAGALQVSKLVYSSQPCRPRSPVEGGSSEAPLNCGTVANLPVGPLIHEAKTPEQIALYLPITGSLSPESYAAVRYKMSSEGKWKEAHPLLRLAPQDGSDGFAGVIFDLEPGTRYDVEVQVTDPDAGTQLLVGNFSTRALHRIAGTATATPRSIDDFESAIAAAAPGDVIELQNGTYKIADDIIIRASGTAENPIYIRGQSKAGTILDSSSTSGTNIQIWGSHIVFENMTLVGAGGDNSNPAIVIGYSGTPEIVANYLTIRDINTSGHGRAVMTSGGTSGTNANYCLVYNNEFIGQNPWTNDFFDSSIGWSDDGIRLVGTGNCVWGNTLQGFGDSITFSHSVKDDSIRACFAYRNFIRNSVDDVFEFDYALRNLAAYDNYIENCSTVMSLDDRPSAGGSIWCFRNVAININVRPFKMNSAGYGYLIYSNTFVRTEAASKNPRGHYRRGWSKLNSTEVDRVAYRNNILIFRAPDALEIMRLRNLAAKIDSSVDWTNNAHFPDTQINWEGDSGKNVFSNLAEAKANIRATNPLFPSGAGLGAPSARHTDDVICASNPFVNSIALDRDGATEVKGRTTPTLRSGSAPKNAGINIPNITDGYSGSQPDMGAVIDGRPPPSWGANYN